MIEAPTKPKRTAFPDRYHYPDLEAQWPALPAQGLEAGQCWRISTIVQTLSKPKLVQWAARLERELPYKDYSRCGKYQYEQDMERTGDIGTRVHEEIGRRLRGGVPTLLEHLPADVRPSIRAFEKWWARTQPKVLAVEDELVNVAARNAGTSDLLCEIGGVWEIVEFKTSSACRTSHMLQVGGYFLAYKSTAPWGYVMPGRVVGLPRNGRPFWERRLTPEQVQQAALGFTSCAVLMQVATEIERRLENR